MYLLLFTLSLISYARFLKYKHVNYLAIKSMLINKGTVIALWCYTDFPVKRGRGCGDGEHKTKQKKCQKEENKQGCLWTMLCKTPQNSPCQKLCSDWSSHSLLLAARSPQGWHSWAATAWLWPLSQGCSCSVTLLTPEQAARSFPLHLCVKDGPQSTTGSRVCSWQALQTGLKLSNNCFLWTTMHFPFEL